MPARLLILGEVGLYREALAGALGRDERFQVVAVVASVENALEVLGCVGAHVVLVDSRMAEGTDAVRALSVAAPQVKLVALGVPEVEGDVIAVAEAGASAYVTPGATMEDLPVLFEGVLDVIDKE